MAHGEGLLRERAIALLTRGAVHCLNNSLALLSAHLQLADAGVPPPVPGDRRPLQRAIERAKAAVDVLDALAAGPSDEPAGPVCLGHLVRSLGEALLLEGAAGRFPVEVHADGQVETGASRQGLLILIATILEHLARTAPAPVGGSIGLEVSAPRDAERPCVLIEFRIQKDHLPFRFPAQQLDPEIMGMAQRHDIEVETSTERPAYRLRPPAPATNERTGA